MLNDVMTTKEVAKLWSKGPNSVKQFCTGTQGQPPPPWLLVTGSASLDPTTAYGRC